MNKKFIVLILLFVFFCVSSNCLAKETTESKAKLYTKSKISSSIEACLKDNNIEYQEIVHKEATKKGILAFYHSLNENNPSWGIAYIEKTSAGWSIVMNSTHYKRQIPTPFDIDYIANLDKVTNKETPFPLFYGRAQDLDLEKVVLTNPETNESKNATLVNVNDQNKLWFCFVPETEETDLFKIECLEKNGERTEYYHQVKGKNEPQLLELAVNFFKKITSFIKIILIIIIGLIIWLKFK